MSQTGEIRKYKSPGSRIIKKSINHNRYSTEFPKYNGNTQKMYMSKFTDNG